MTEFKKGDKLIVVDNQCYEIHFKKGDIVTCSEDMTLNGDSVKIETKSGKQYFPFSRRFELAKKSSFKLKEPKYVVVWEEDTDPARFFVDKKKADEFIKKLTENSNVKQDSIILVEIKSVKKVQVTKSLRTTAYKI